MKSSIIQIPVPCHENWDAMSHQEKGRFCGVCSKTVMDFSKHSKNEIVTYLTENADQKVCGSIPARMLNDNLSFPIQVEQKMKLSRFAFALFLVFGNFLFAQGQTNIKGKIRVEPVEQTQTPDSLSLKDSLQNGTSLPMTDTSGTSYIIEEPMILGMIVLPIEPLFIEPEVETLKGEIEIIAKPDD